MVKGIVERLTSKDVNGTVLWSFKLRNDNTWYRSGKYKPDIKENQKVTFELYNAEKNQVDGRSLKTHGFAEPKPASGGSSGGGGAGMTKNDYWERKEERDLEKDHVYALQNARYAAIQFLNALIENGAVSLGQQKAKKLDTYQSLFYEYVEKFYKENLQPKLAFEKEDVPFNDELPEDLASEDQAVATSSEELGEEDFDDEGWE